MCSFSRMGQHSLGSSVSLICLYEIISFSRGKLKARVYAHKQHTLDDLKEAILVEVKINRAILERWRPTSAGNFRSVSMKTDTT